jgi:hypothetical protein
MIYNSITAFLDSVHCLVFQTEHVSEPGFVSVLTWKGEEAPTQLGTSDIISSIIPNILFCSEYYQITKVQKLCNINSNIFFILPEYLCMISFLPLLTYSLHKSVGVKHQVQQPANDMRHYGSRTAELHFFYQLHQNTELSLPFATVKLNSVKSRIYVSSRGSIIKICLSIPIVFRGFEKSLQF